MKTLFVVNPVAGRGKGIEKLMASIEKAADSLSVEVDCYKTRGHLDCEEYLGAYISENARNEKIRIYVAGGDGTVNEAVNGTWPFMKSHSISIGCIPIGTGNDFVRNFSGRDFLNIENQLRGETRDVDLIAYESFSEKGRTSRLCLNMINIGFDADVAHNMIRFKKPPLIQGSLSYLLSIFATLIKKEGALLEIRIIDGEVKVGDEKYKDFYEGEVLLMATGNGSFCGGGIKCTPMARLSDGLLDISIAKNLGRIGLLKLFPYYQKGTHFETEKGRKIVTYIRARGAEVISDRGPLRYCVDGENGKADSLSFSILPGAISFILPKIPSLKEG